MDSASLQIKFVPLIQTLENKSLCLIEILPEISNMTGLENIEWQKTDDQIEYSIPMNYKVILRKVNESDLKCHIETEYNSCVELPESDDLLDNNEDNEMCLNRIDIDLSREESNHIDLSNHLGNHNLNPMKSNYWDCCNSIFNKTLSRSFVYSSMEPTEYTKCLNEKPLLPKILLSQISIKTSEQYNKNSQMIQTKVLAVESEDEPPKNNYTEDRSEDLKTISNHEPAAQDKETYVVNCIQGLLSHITLPTSKADTDLIQIPHKIAEDSVSCTVINNTVIEAATETVDQPTVATKNLTISPLCSVNTMPDNINDCQSSRIYNPEKNPLPYYHSMLSRLSRDSSFYMRLPNNLNGMFYTQTSYTNLKISTPFVDHVFSKMDKSGEEKGFEIETMERDSGISSFQKSNIQGRVLPEVRIARMLEVLKKELLPLKITLNEVINKCSRLDPIFRCWNKNTFKTTTSYRQTKKMYDIKHKEQDEIIQSNRVVYTYVFDG